MAIDIINFKIKKLNNLVIPLKSLYLSVRKDWHPSEPSIIDAETMLVEIEGGCEQTIKGYLKDGLITVTEMDLTGEGSSSFRYYVLDEALKHSTGELEIVFVYEDGEIYRLNVLDGILNEDKIDL